MKLADKWVHPTMFTGDWPNWNGYTWLDWVASSNCYHPGDDYNKGSGFSDYGQSVCSVANGVVFHTSESTTGYGKIIIIKHSLGYNLSKFVKDTYGIETSTLYSLYAHLKDILVAVGNEVESGALIAHVGKSGTKSPHLHEELYHLDGDLKNTSYRFYPVGWDKEKVKKNWLPPYLFIESVKNIESYEEFLGKPKAYWEQIEKDREKLLVDLGNKDQEFLKIKVALDEEIRKLTIKNQQLGKDIARNGENTEKLLTKHGKRLLAKDGIIERKKEKIVDSQNRLTLCLAKQVKDYKPREAFKLFINSFKNLRRRT